MTSTHDPEWRPLGDDTADEIWTNGEHVKRPMRPWYDAIHQLLRHLERRDVPGVPRFVSTDDGYQRLTYLPGTAAKRPWPQALQSTDWMTDLGRWLGQVHDATRDFELDADTTFAWGPTEPSPHHVVTHGDLGPWNMLVDDGTFAGVIDWEFARFGPPLDDLAEAALELGPLRENRAMLAGDVTTQRILERLDALCHGYGDVTPDDLLDRVEPMCLDRIDEQRRLAAAGHPPFPTLVDAGALDALADDLTYFRDHWKT